MIYKSHFYVNLVRSPKKWHIAGLKEEKTCTVRIQTHHFRPTGNSIFPINNIPIPWAAFQYSFIPRKWLCVFPVLVLCARDNLTVWASLPCSQKSLKGLPGGPQGLQISVKGMVGGKHLISWMYSPWKIKGHHHRNRIHRKGLQRPLIMPSWI